MHDEPVADAPELPPSKSASQRWQFMFAALRHSPQQDRRAGQGGFDGAPIDLDRRQTAAYARAAKERALLLDVAINVLLAKHTRHRPPRESALASHDRLEDQQPQHARHVDALRARLALPRGTPEKPAMNDTPEQRQAVADAEAAMLAAAEKVLAAMQPIFTPARRTVIEQTMAEGGELRVEASVDGVGARRVTLSIVTAGGHRTEIASLSDRPQPLAAS